MADFFGYRLNGPKATFRSSGTGLADCDQPTRTLTKLRFQQFQRVILSRLTVGAQIRHGNPPFLRLTAEFERSGETRNQ